MIIVVLFNPGHSMTLRFYEVALQISFETALSSLKKSLGSNVRRPNLTFLIFLKERGHDGVGRSLVMQDTTQQKKKKMLYAGKLSFQKLFYYFHGEQPQEFQILLDNSNGKISY